MNKFTSRLSLLATIALFSVPFSALFSASAKAEGALEAIIAPQLSMAMGGGTRTRLGVDFYRVSSGPSLSAHYGFGGNYNDLTGLFRISNHFKTTDSESSTGIIYGLGVGYTWAMDSSETADDSFGAATVNPYLRYLVDFTGRIGAYVELGYEFAVAGIQLGDNAPAKSDIRSNNNKFVIAIGIPFESERSRPE